MSGVVGAGCAKARPAPVAEVREGAPPVGLSEAAWGERLYQSHGCFACHPINGAGGAGGHLDRLWGTERPMHDGTTVTFDEAYARESIVAPSARVVLGMPNRMPSYASLVSDAELEALVAFLATLR